RLGGAPARGLLRPGSVGSDGCAGQLDVVTDRGHELLERIEAALLADRAPELDQEPLAVEVTVEVEQVRLDPAFDAVEVGARPDRHGGAPVTGPACIHAVGRDEQPLRDVEVRGRKTELASASVAADDGPLDLRGPPEQRRRPVDLTGVDELPYTARGDVLHERHAAHVEAKPLEQLEIALAPTPEAKRLAGGDGLHADPAEQRFGELDRRKRGEPLVEAEHEDVLDPGVLEQL